MEISKIAQFDADTKILLTQKLKYSNLSDVQQMVLDTYDCQ